MVVGVVGIYEWIFVGRWTHVQQGPEPPGMGQWESLVGRGPVPVIEFFQIVYLLYLLCDEGILKPTTVPF